MCVRRNCAGLATVDRAQWWNKGWSIEQLDVYLNCDDKL